MASTIRGDDNFDSAGVGKNATAGAVGTYAALWPSTTSTSNEGTTVSGSSLHYCGFFTYANASYASSRQPSGTWRRMGVSGYYAGSGAANSDKTSTLWLRIS